jgi:hypothetical protein
VIKEIPARIETYCDFCGELCTRGVRRKSSGVVLLKQDGLNMYGVNASRGFDACDRCLERIETFVLALLHVAE